tara:strand:+ start:654 stop:875 length:222 start_codon:yes stop_codon:yes gene_type:complete
MNNEKAINWNANHDNQGRPTYHATIAGVDYSIVPNLDRYFQYTEYICRYRGSFGYAAARGTVSEVMNKIAKIA